MENAIAFALLVGATSFSAFAADGNIARGCRYWFDVEPNYGLCKDAADTTDLTDGFLSDASGGQMWCKKSTVGWAYRPSKIVLDLGARKAISGFGCNTPGGSASVSYLSGLDVYIADETNTWRYVGDLWSKSCARTGAPDGTRYGVYHAESHDMPCAGRYVMFIPSTGGGIYCFMDELEVFGGDPRLLDKPPRGMVVTDFKAHFTAKCVPQKMLNDLERLVRDSSVLSGEKRRAFDAAVERVRPATERLPTEAELKIQKTSLPLNPEHAAIWALNAKLLRAAGHLQPFVWTNCRWDNLDPLSKPERKAPTPVVVEMMRGESRSAAVNVCNPTDCAIRFTARLIGFPPESNPDLAEVLYSDTKELLTVSGAIGHGGGTNLVFEVPAGVSKQLWLTFRKPRGKSAISAGSLVLDYDGGSLVEDVKLVLHNLDFPARQSMRLTGWDYMSADQSFYNRQAGEGADNAQANLKVMREMLADAPCAGAAVRPAGAKFGTDGRLLNFNDLDMSKWDKWTAKFPAANGYFVFLAVVDAFEGEKIATPRFNKMVGDYFAAWAKLIAARGIDPKKVVLQLIDENHTHEMDRRLIAWARAIRAGTDAFSLFDDLIWEDPTQALPELFSVCDILCPMRAMYGATEKNRAFYRSLRETGKRIWTYSCSGPSRSFDPIVYYRSQAWDIFSCGGDGMGFWAFGCGGGCGDSWRAYWQPGIEYSPYFVSAHDALRGKQSEAIMEGVEDFEYLTMLKRRIVLEPDEAVRTELRQLLRESLESVDKVVAGSSHWSARRDREVADRARIRILRKLARMKKSGRRSFLAIGDSITAAGVWQRKAGELLDMDVRTHAKGGIGIRHMVDGIGDFPPLSEEKCRGVDAVFVVGFYNDRNLWENDRMDDLRHVVNTVKEKLAAADNARARIVLVAPHRHGRNSWYKDDAYLDGDRRADAVAAVAAETGCGFVDWMRYGGIVRENWCLYQSSAVAVRPGMSEVVNQSMEKGPRAEPYPWLADQLHPNEKGYERLGETLVRELTHIDL